MLPADQPERAARRKIGKYAVVGRIGRGGMGMVYRGWDEVLEREVAVKTLTVEGTLDQESRQRFQIEARAAARLQHANIVTVFELGEDRGLPFIAMELLPGVDLETLVRSGEPLLLEEKLEIMVQVLRGLHFAHEHGIVHRDIKPSNIRLLEDGTAKIMDFGIAKLGGTGVTKTGMMVGKVDDALHRLQDVTQRHPRSIEARRALRTAARERERRLKPREPEAQDFPELDATYQGSPTRRTADTVMQPGPAVPATVLLGATPAAVPAAPVASTRTLMLAAAAALLVVVVVGVLLLMRPPRVAPPVTVHVRSEPTGAQVLLDGQDTGVVTDGDVTLPAATSGTVTLTLRKPEYREATRVLRLPLGASDLRFVMEALPVVVTSTVALPIVTEPPGAAVTVDGQAVKGTTPLTVSVDPAREHRIAVRLEGHAPQEASVAAGAAAAPVRFTLDALGPQGRVPVSAAYP